MYVISRATTQAAIPGQSGSGGSDTQNYCYDEQDRLVWAANNGTIPAAGNGTCGSATISSTLGGNYTARYAYTNLGQLWQGPQNGSGAQEQYLYCDSSHPHQLSNLSEISSSPTCSSKGTIDYTGSYDAWGNTTSQQRGSTTKSTAYDAQDHLLHWSSTTNSQQEWYLYDASGERVLRRSFDGTNTTLTVYAFGLEEHQYAYSGSGSIATNTGNTYYYALAGRLLGTWDGSSPTTTFLLTDSLGSVVSSFNNPSSGAVVQGNQLYGPYGNQRLKQGSLSTSKGFTGQYNDGLTGLDYYGARYYDPTIGLFLAADSVQGNLQAENPYAYVHGNPETLNDPTGQWSFGDFSGLVQVVEQTEQAVQQFVDTEPLPVVAGVAAISAPFIAPFLVAGAIGIGLGLIAGAAYVALTTKNLSSGARFAQSFAVPRHNNPPTQPSGHHPPQAAAGGGSGQGGPPSGGHTAPPPSPDDHDKFRKKIEDLKQWREQQNNAARPPRPPDKGVSAEASADGVDPIRRVSGFWGGQGEPIEGWSATRYVNAENGAGACAEWQLCAEFMRNSNWWGANIQIDLESGGRPICTSCDPTLQRTADLTGSSINVTRITDAGDIVSKFYQPQP